MPRQVPACWPAGERRRAEIVELAGSWWSGLGPKDRAARRRGLELLLDWLEEHPGQRWQERWFSSGADSAGATWDELPATWLEKSGKARWRLETMTSAVALLVGADVLRPSLRWILIGGKKRKLARHLLAGRDPDGFRRLQLACEADPALAPTVPEHIAFRCAMIMAAKGGTLSDIVVGDLLEILDAEAAVRGRVPYGAATLRVLRSVGVFSPDVPSLRELLSEGQRSVEELVDRYQITNAAVRYLLVAYLKERQPALDYTSLRNLCYVLARCFWVDIEAHQPGIDTLALPRGVASAWKQRLRTRTTIMRTSAGEAVEVSVERLSYLDVLAAVRAFYLDLSEWALEEPNRWGCWAAPCPIRPEELSRTKAVRRRKARMDARTRERLPALPMLVPAASRWRREAASLLEAGCQVSPGEQFSAAEQTLVRSSRPHGVPGNVWADDPATGNRRLLNREEKHAFWAWAVIEVLRLTGMRVEELLELSHYSLVQYRLPASGELVPLLQIAPSKTDAERLLAVSPELADVLSTIIYRVRGPEQTVPLVRARDYHEHVWLPPAPLLFQHRLGAEHHAFSIGMVSSLLDEALSRTGLTDQSGSPLRCTPHDFRRMFITDAVMNGLPPHIAQVIAGHRDLKVTMGYKAVYPEEAIQAHLAFLARRRSLRPSEEYRTPTEEEWQEFLGHFERRKVSVGTCARAFGTPCIHEHACVRCSMLWPDPAQRDRLVEIRDNLVARIEEAEREGWLGEVEGLQVSLAGAEDKLAQIDRQMGSLSIELRQKPEVQRQKVGLP
ncbi:MAG: site-specific integrase [Acidimicrobiales bacterium]